MCGLCGDTTDTAVIVTDEQHGGPGVLYACADCAIIAEDLEYGEVFFD